MSANPIADLVAQRLRGETARMGPEFARPRIGGTRSTLVDELLPPDLARGIYEAFPPTGQMRLASNFRERKYTSRALERMTPLIHDAVLAFQTPEVIQAVSAITGLRDMVGDPKLYAGGISSMTRGHFLNPHIDNSHDSEGRLYRVLNLLYYVTPEWRVENGGNLELWDERVHQRLEIPSLFNRLVIMETNQKSWHSVNRVRVDGKRCCVSNYYFSPHSPNGADVSHITFFAGRPEQPLGRLLAAADGPARTLLRRVVKRGLAREDVYRGDKPGG